VQSISRDTVLQSSNGGAKISLTGVSVVFCVIPAEKLVFKDINNTVQLSSDLEIDGLVSDYIYAASGDFTNGLTSNTFVSNDVNITDLSVVGSLGSSGLLTLRRTSAGNFFHAYIDDLNDRTISLYSDGITPTWKLGLKNSPLSETQSPTYAYVYATDGGFGLVGNEDNKLTISNYEPFVIKHQGVDIISGHHSTGIHIQSNSSAYPALKINGGALLSANIQEWNNSADDTLAYVDANGNFFTTGNISSTTGNFNAIRFSDSTIQSTAGLPIYSGAIINQQIVAVSGWAENYVDSQEGSTTAISGWILNSFTTISDSIALSGWLEYYVDSQDHSAIAVSGWARDYIDSQDHSALSVSGWAEATFLTQDDDSYVSGVATYASGLADQNVLDIATVSGLLSDAYDDTPISGYFESRVDFNESQITAVSGFAREYVDSQDHSAIAVSGWARDYVDSQDHSAALVSGALQPQIIQNASDLSTVSGLLSTVGDRFTSDITVSLGGGKTFGRYENGDVIPSSGLKPSQVISLAVTEPISPTASLTSSSAVDFNQVNVSTTLNFSHTINSLGATVTSASLEFRRGNSGSWTVLSTSTSASSSYNHTFTDTAFNTAVLNYRYTVTDTAGATTTVTKDIYPDTYSAPSISFSVAAVSTTSPETNSSRERGNVNSNISGSINRNESYVDLISYTLQYSVNNGTWTDIGSAVSIGPGNSTISSTNHNPTSSNTATSIRYRVKVVDDYTTSYSSISTVSFGYLIFYGPSSSAPTTSANVRALPSRLFTTGNNTFTLNTGSTEINFTVAIPSTESISEVIDLDALNANITSQYVNNAFNVDDAGGTAVSYNVYTMTQAAAYSSNHRHQVTKG